MLNGFRKGRILIESLDDFSFYKNFISKQRQEGVLRDSRYQFENNFSLHLQSKQIEIDPVKITGFKLKKSTDEQMLTVKTSLYINEWIEDFKCVDFVKIVLYDLKGNINMLMDFEINYIGHRISCDYGNENILSPIFDYKIIE